MDNCVGDVNAYAEMKRLYTEHVKELKDLLHQRVVDDISFFEKSKGYILDYFEKSFLS